VSVDPFIYIIKDEKLDRLDISLQISYDFSQHLLKSTNIIELSENPWVCSCSSQITDLVYCKVQQRILRFLSTIFFQEPFDKDQRQKGNGLWSRL